jgi:hypothetical protein
MSDQWFYRIKGQEFGPVALDLVRSLVASGTIAPDDEVRDSARSNWLLACAATELRDAVKPDFLDSSVERRITRDEWFCRGATGEFGPLKLIDLIRLAADGELLPDEEIKAKADDYWKQVRTYQRLIQLLPFHDASYLTGQRTFGYSPPVSVPNSIDRNAALTHDDPPSVLLFPGVRSTASDSVSVNSLPNASFPEGSLAQSECSPDTRTVAATTSESLTKSPALGVLSTLDHSSVYEETDPIRMWGHQDSNSTFGNSQWTGWIGGEEFGPIDYTELLTWAVTGQLSPMDFVRRGTDGQYVPAVNIPCLFTVRAAANSLSRPVLHLANANSDSGSNLEGMIEVETPPEKNTTIWGRRSTDRTNAPSTEELNAIAGTIPVTSTAARAITDTLGEAPTPLPNAALRKLVSDPTSIGVSAILTIGLVLLGWAAMQ